MASVLVDFGELPVLWIVTQFRVDCLARHCAGDISPPVALGHCLLGASILAMIGFVQDLISVRRPGHTMLQWTLGLLIALPPISIFADHLSRCGAQWGLCGFVILAAITVLPNLVFIFGIGSIFVAIIAVAVRTIRSKNAPTASEKVNKRST